MSKREAPTPSPAAKRPRTGFAKGDAPSMNVNGALCKEFEHLPLLEIRGRPPFVIQGISENMSSRLARFGIKTVENLARWSAFTLSRAVVRMAALEEAGKRSPDSAQNVARAVHTRFEGKSLAELATESPTALVSVPPDTAEHLKALNIDTIQKLATWKFAEVAESLYILSHFEATEEEMKNDFRSPLTGGM
eukprot:TRINITY_DN45046_c0_g1_i1.p1 TRINITY_DN45046_c0_g1~~TRINITY_DN45046_c0_g1_i1.p1  ORF type:complete len:192 (+),score=63.10 TRINITY_DN45046_c0_g1_i1:66-641(+)